MANVKIYQRHFFTFFIFANVRPVLMKVKLTQTHTETGKPIAIDEILQICLTL